MEAIRIDIEGALDRAIGARGIPRDELHALQGAVSEAHDVLVGQRSRGEYGFYDLYKDRESFARCQAVGEEFYAHGYENLVVLGIGGSALGTTALVTALKPPYYNLLSVEERQGRPRVFVMDNVDAESFGQMLRLCAPERTLYNVISKSGGTSETVAQLLIVLDGLVRAVGKSSVRHHLIITAGPTAPGAVQTVLGRVADEYDLQRFDVPENVGGRFSVFSPVGMLPAALLGMDLDGFAAGCAAMDGRSSEASLETNPAYQLAALHYLGWRQRGHAISVMLPYAHSLWDVADWYRQLWAESLGKRKSLDDEDGVFAGQTPVKALGVTDQHSQLQLYLEGPHDKLITVLEVEAPRETLAIPADLCEEEDVAYLRGHTLNDLLKAECNATVDALREAERPVIRIALPTVNEHTIGQLLYMFEVATAMAGRLMNVDAFDQPAVERIKVLTRWYLKDLRG